MEAERCGASEVPSGKPKLRESKAAGTGRPGTGWSQRHLAQQLACLWERFLLPPPAVLLSPFYRLFAARSVFLWSKTHKKTDHIV